MKEEVKKYIKKIVDISEKNVEYYKNTRADLERSKSEERGALDKALFVIVTGTLVLLVNYILTDVRYVCPVLILFTFFVLVLSLLAYLFAYHISEKRIISMIANLDRWSDNDFNPSRFNPETSCTKKLRKRVIKLNNFVFYTLIVSIFTLSGFLLINYKNKNMEIDYNNPPLEEREEKANSVTVPDFNDENEDENNNKE